MLAKQEGVGLGLLDRVEVVALDILNQGDFQQSGAGHLTNKRRNGAQPGEARGPTTTFPDHETKTVPFTGNHYWLNDPVLPYRSR
ncbi:MAG: hypothetical protein AMXMBFR33_03710 [Candidatus Xenobia bacterium]